MGCPTLIIFGAAGALVGLTFTGWAASKVGTRRLLVWSTYSHLLAYAAVGFSAVLGLPAMFAIGHFFVSFASRLQTSRSMPKPRTSSAPRAASIMAQFHAAFSVGMAVALAVGALVSHLEVPVVWHLVAVGVILAIARLVMIPAATMDGRPIAVEAGARLGGPFATAKAEYREPRIVMIGLIVFAGAMTEFSAAQWVALAAVDDFGLSESTGDLMYWLFVLSMVSVRVFGARVVARFGRVVTLRVSAVSIGLGVLGFALSPVFALVPVALVLWGVGAALGIPLGFSAAADDPKRAAARVAAVSSFSTLAGLVVPQVIGHVAGATTLRLALLLVLLAPAMSFLLARAVRPSGRVFGRHSPNRAQRKAIAARFESDLVVPVATEPEPPAPAA